MAALDVGTSLATLRTMLSGLSAWQTICGVSTSAEAAKRIHYGAVELDQDEPTSSSNPCIVLDITSLSTKWLANRLQGTAVFEMRFYLEMPEAEKSTYSVQYIWIWQQFSAMLAAINGAVGGAGQSMIDSLDVPLMPGRLDPDQNGGGSEWNFVISMGVDFI
jgi:hypothetical protein